MTREEQMDFFEQYSGMAIEQQKKYGIPASVTLAQMALESGYGQGRAIKEGNNAFCVKGTYNGQYVLISDDSKDEKFKRYPSLEESFEDHSRVLTSKHYAHCRKYDSTDYKNWCIGLQSGASTGGKYATDPQYSQKLIAMIEKFDLQKYDRVGAGQSPGHARNRLQSAQGYSFPIGGQLVVTDTYGREATSYRSHAHKGIDLRASNTDVMATENNGKIVSVGNDPKASGKYIIVEYDRADGAKWRVSYCHLSDIAVKVGDTVNAGQKIGVSGNTGSSTAPHLHLTVKRKEAGKDSFEHTNPLDYLAEISVRGNLAGKVVAKGKQEDLLASRKANVDTTPTPADKMLAGNGSPDKSDNPLGLSDEQLKNMEQGKNPNSLIASLLGIGNDNSGDNSQGVFGSIGNMVSSLFSSMISMAFFLERTKGGSPQSLEASRQQIEADAEQQAETLVRRRRDTIDPDVASQTASMNFDIESPEVKQTSVQRLS